MSEISKETEVAAFDKEADTLEGDPVTASRAFMFPGDLESIWASREEVMRWLRQYGCDEGDEIDLRVALQEALANAALHGCGNDATKTIYCSAEIEPSKASIVIRDPGPGFDFQTAADPKRFSPTTLERGRGIALMRSMVDEVTFARGGSEVRLCKRMGCREGSARVKRR